MRSPHAEGARGSLKWLQRAIEHKPQIIQPKNLPTINWRSPLRSDEFAEYRDASFLNRIGCQSLVDQLSAFWPSRGPQWDALGVFDNGVLLVEAKAHINEFFSPPSQASQRSLLRIKTSLQAVAEDLGSNCGEDWHRLYFQYANRIAHLAFMRQNGVNAHLALIGFVGDEDMNGPMHAEAWTVAYQSADYVLGLKKSHKLSKYIHHVCPNIRDLIW